MGEWTIQIRDDVGEPWHGCEEDDYGTYATKREAQRRLRDLREIGLLDYYDASRVVEVQAKAGR